MQRLLFTTTNKQKFAMAHTLCASAGIELEQVFSDIPEIQSEDAEIILRDKAEKAFTATQAPVIVSDDSWSIAGLNGFPGPYMKSMNHWFTPDNFIDLTQNLKDRSIILMQYLAYQDDKETVTFRRDSHGTLLTEARGQYGPPLLKIVALESDSGRSLAEVYDSGEAHTPERLKNHPDVWRDLIEWYKKKEEV